MPQALFGRPSHTSTRNFLVATTALLLSLTVHFGVYEVVRDRLFTTRVPTAPAPTPMSEDETPTRVVIEEEAGGETADPMKAADPLAEEPSMPDDLVSKSIPAAIFEPPPAPELPPPAAMLPEPPPVEQAELPPPRELPAPDILAVTDARARDLAAPFERREIPDIERHLLSPDITLSYSVETPLPAMDAAAALAKIPDLLLGASSDPAAVLLPAPAPTPAERARAAAETVPDVGPVDEGTVVSAILPEPAAEVAPATPLDDRLTVAVESIRPADDPDHVYFKIDVAPRDAVALPDIPRDIVFVQDTSASLNQSLEHCRPAIRAALRTLRPTDRFNICAFSTTNVFLAKNAWLSPTPETFALADAFVDSLVAGGNTDLFGSMQEILTLPRDPNRATIALVLSDGELTAGKLSRDSAVIGTFARLNNGAVSVFTIGVGRRSQPFLLDMLSFCDRGGNTAIVGRHGSRDTGRDIGPTIASVFGSIGQPILANVRFNFDVASQAEVFPTLTSNLYRDRPLRLYGRVPADRPSFAFQARGDANGDKYDMLFDIDLHDAAVAKASATLPTEWATQQMYDLVAQYARVEDPALLREMLRLGAKYDIPVPHAQRLGLEH